MLCARSNTVIARFGSQDQALIHKLLNEVFFLQAVVIEIICLGNHKLLNEVFFLQAVVIEMICLGNHGKG